MLTNKTLWSKAAIPRCAGLRNSDPWCAPFGRIACTSPWAQDPQLQVADIPFRAVRRHTDWDSRIHTTDTTSLC